MKRHFLTTFIAAMIVLSAHAAAAQDAFLLIPNIPGGSTDARHQNWIDVLSLSQSFDRTVAKRQSACTVAVAKALDKAGPLLWAAAVTGQVFPSMQIEVLRASDSPVKYYELVLNNAVISSIATDPINLVETLTLQGVSATLTFYTQRPDGTQGDPVSSTVSCK